MTKKKSDKETKAFGIFSVEWDNKGELFALEAGVLIIVFLMLGNLNAIFLNFNQLALASTTSFLMNLIVFAGVIFVGEKAFESLGDKKHDIFETIGWGKNYSSFFFAIIAGAFFAFALTIFGQSIITPAVQSFAGDPLNLLFVVFFAAMVEETFFRGTLMPSINKTLQVFNIPFSGELAIVGSSIVFGLFHLGVLWSIVPNASIFDARIIVSVLFGVLVCLGNGLFQSTGFGYSAHLTNNFLVAVSTGLV